MGRRSIWKRVQHWLSPGSRRRTGEVTSERREGFDPLDSPLGEDPSEWPANVLPFVRPAGRAPADSAEPAFYAADVDGAGAAAVLEDDFSEAELLDFLAADVDPFPADPAFRARLRERLWTMLEQDASREARDKEEERQRGSRRWRPDLG